MDHKADNQERASSHERVCVLILGMHRSGTSALARVLNLLGADLPTHLMRANAANKAGYWESATICALNDDLLSAIGSSWYDVSCLDKNWLGSDEVRKFIPRAISAMQSEFDASKLFILKDPRICRLVPFWLDIIHEVGTQSRVILPIRNPIEVAASLRKRDGFPLELSHLIWLRHVLDAEASSRGVPRLICSYDALMDDWQKLAVRAESVLGISWPYSPEQSASEINAFLTEELRHHRETPRGLISDPSSSAWLRETFEIFSRWSNDGEDPGDFGTLDRIRNEFDEAVPNFIKFITAVPRDLVRRESENTSVAQIETRLRDAIQAIEEEKAARAILEAQLQNALKIIEEEKAARALLESQFQTATAKTEAEAVKRRCAETQLAIRFEEIVALTRLMREKELMARDRGAIEELLKPRSLFFLPSPFLVWRQMTRIRRSGLFDAKWYRTTNKDVAKSGMDPLRHFVCYGFREGRASRAATVHLGESSPTAINWHALPLLLESLHVWWQAKRIRRSGIFDAEWYCRINEDVAASGMDPLTHYVRYGVSEGRAPNAQLAVSPNGRVTK